MVAQRKFFYGVLERAKERANEVAKEFSKSRPPASDMQAPAGEPIPSLLAIASELLGANAGAIDGVAGSPFDTPGAVTELGRRYQLSATLQRRQAARLRKSDFPVLVTLKDGSGRLLTGRSADRGFVCRGAAGRYEISAQTLAREETGSLLQLGKLGLDPEGKGAASEGRDDPLRLVFEYLFAHRRKLIVEMLLAAAFSNLMLVALPVYTGLVYDRVIPHNAIDTLWAVSVGIVVALASDLAMRSMRMKLQDAMAAQASAALQSRAVGRMLTVRFSDAPRSAAAFLMRLREIENLAQLAPAFMAGVLVDIPFLVFVFGLIWADGGPTVFAPLAGAVLVGVAYEAASHLSMEQQLRSSRLSQEQTNRLTEAIESLESVKTSRAELRMLRRFETLYDEYAYSAHISRLWSGLSSYASMTVGQFMIVMVMLIGVYRISAGAMTLGELSSCSLLVGRVITPIGQVVAVLHKLRQSREVYKTLKSVGSADRQEEAGDDASLGAPREGAISVRNLTFGYQSGMRQLNGVSFDIRPGERVALIGRSGSGKSTLLKLLVRLLEPEEGAIQIDGLDARQYVPADLRSSLGLMSQAGALFDGDLLSNMTFGLRAPAPDAIAAAARISGVHDFAARHPKGFSLQVGPRGAALSGGERQSVLLGRLLLANPKILLLDEPTASMDTSMETRVVRDLKQYLGPRTLIVATHRAPVLELVDRIIWLDGGRIVADGAKSDVLKRMSGAA